MNINDLKPASHFAKKFGVKCLVYGGPGTGKTPIVQTAPNPVLCAVEPGLLSMRYAKNVATFEAYTPDKIDEFFKWFFNSNEAKRFDTIAIDSISQLATVYLEREEKKSKHGMQAYGEMARKVMNIVNNLYYMPEKHIYMIAKLDEYNDGDILKKRPNVPGNVLKADIPHLFDELFYIDLCQIPGIVKPQIAFRTQNGFDYKARDRSGKLAEFEPPNLTNIFNKCMS